MSESEHISKTEQPVSKRYEQLLLVYGMQRSGSSLLAAYLGNHPDINMFFEANKNIFRYSYGRKIAANKLVNTQIRFDRRANWFIYKLNWIIRHMPFARTNKDFWYWRPFSQVTMSIKDYIDLGAKVIVIRREKEQIFESTRRRVGYSREQFEKEHSEFLDTCSRINEATDPHNLFVVEYDKLCNEKTETMKNICSFLEIEFSEYMLSGEKRNYAYLKA